MRSSAAEDGERYVQRMSIRLSPDHPNKASAAGKVSAESELPAGGSDIVFVVCAWRRTRTFSVPPRASQSTRLAHITDVARSGLFRFRATAHDSTATAEFRADASVGPHDTALLLGAALLPSHAAP